MLNLVVFPNVFTIEGDFQTLNFLHELYSFRDKAVEHQIRRHQASLEYRRRFPEFDRDKWEERGEALKSKLQVYCCERVENQLIVPIGLLKKTIHYLEGSYLYSVTCQASTVNLERKNLIGKLTGFRPPQALAYEAALKAGSGLIRMATGVGKTLVGQEIIRHYGLPAIFLVPSKPILEQTIDRFEYAFGRKNVGIFGAGKKRHSWVTVATYQSVFNTDADKFYDYGVMIADEVHHIGADTFFECAQKRITNAIHRFGLTADEERADGGTILVEAAVGPVIYSYEAHEAIRDQYLAKPTFIIYEVRSTAGTYIKWKITENKKRVQDEILQSVAYIGEDAHKAYKNWVLGNDILTEKIAGIIKAFESDNKNVLVLIDEIEHGDKLMTLLPTAGFVIGGQTGNDRIVRAFNRRILKVIVATSTLGEGADTIAVDVLVNLMGGTRPKQANGRALRNDPDPSGKPRKPTCLIVDFDFPHSSVLNRHSIMREEVHQTCGLVHRLRLI